MEAGRWKAGAKSRWITYHAGIGCGERVIDIGEETLSTTNSGGGQEEEE